MKKQKNISGQVLVIVLLVLSIVGIFVIAIASNAQRDIQQTIRDEKYEQYYSLAEQVILEAITTTQDLTVYQFNGDGSCLATPGTGGFDCTITKTSETDSSDNVQIELNIVGESNNIEKLPLRKDQTLTLALDGFKNNLILNWTGEKVALNFSLDYIENDTGEYKVLKGIYDGNDDDPVFDGVINDELNMFDFEEVIEDEFQLPSSNNTKFSINSAETGDRLNPLSNWNPISLRIKPIITSGENFTELSVSSDDASFPAQVSKYTATAYSISNIGPQTPTVVLETQIPIHTSPAEFFDYALRSESAVVKPNETGEFGELAGNIFKLDLNEGSGNTIIDGINGLVGTGNGFTESNWVAGIKGGTAAYFPYNSSRYITFPDNVIFDGGTEKTYSVWVKRDPQATIQEIMSKGPQNEMSFAIGVCANGNVYVSARSNISTNNEFSGSSISTGVWHHIVMVVDTSLSATEDVQLYINGLKQVRSSTPNCVGNITNNLTGIWNNTYDMRIGVRRSNSLPLRGAVDNVKIFDKALTQGEITTLYNNEKP